MLFRPVRTAQFHTLMYGYHAHWRRLDCWSFSSPCWPVMNFVQAAWVVFGSRFYGTVSVDLTRHRRGCPSADHQRARSTPGFGAKYQGNAG